MDLAGRTALISGATSGIGQAVAERLAVQVGTLIVHGLEPEASRAAYVSQLRSLGTAQVVYLHYVDGLSLPANTEMLDCRNKSGAKAYLVGGMRKLRRRFQQTAETKSTVL